MEKADTWDFKWYFRIECKKSQIWNFKMHLCDTLTNMDLIPWPTWIWYLDQHGSEDFLRMYGVVQRKAVQKPNGSLVTQCLHSFASFHVTKHLFQCIKSSQCYELIRDNSHFPLCTDFTSDLIYIVYPSCTSTVSQSTNVNGFSTVFTFATHISILRGQLFAHHLCLSYKATL